MFQIAVQRSSCLVFSHRAACVKALCTSQPSVTRHMILLESRLTASLAFVLLCTVSMDE